MDVIVERYLICEPLVVYIGLVNMALLDRELLIDPPPPGGILYTMIF